MVKERREGYLDMVKEVAIASTEIKSIKGQVDSIGHNTQEVEKSVNNLMLSHQKTNDILSDIRDDLKESSASQVRIEERVTALETYKDRAKYIIVGAGAVFTGAVYFVKWLVTKGVGLIN